MHDIHIQMIMILLLETRIDPRRASAWSVHSYGSLLVSRIVFCFLILKLLHKKTLDWLYFMHNHSDCKSKAKTNATNRQNSTDPLFSLCIRFFWLWPWMVFQFSFVSFMHSCCHSLWHSFMRFYFAQLQLQKTQYLQLGQNRAQCYGGSLPNVNQIGNSNTDLPFQVSY